MVPELLQVDTDHNRTERLSACCPMILHQLDNKEVTDKYANASTKLFMTMPESLALAHEMARRIAQLSPRPEVVVGIANGALMITKVIADDLGLPMKILRIRYKSSRVKYRLREKRLLAACFSAWYAIPLVNRPLRWLIISLRKIKVDSHEVNDGLLAGRPVVIVDDAIGTGRTIISAINIIKGMHAEHIHIATISSYEPRTREKIFRDEPDVLITRELQYFPWSSNNGEYPKFLQWLKAHGLQLWK
jgi:orotate phosphoribosyltransferase